MSKILEAPWTEAQVERLETRQEDETKHPYTCECGHSLQPSKAGWYCEECPYKQNWCHAVDAEPKD